MQISLSVSYSETSVLSKFNQAQREDNYYKGGLYDPQLLNRYSQARNNPLIFNDNSGHWLQILLAIGGAMIGFGVYGLTHNNSSFNWGQAALWAGGGAIIAMSLGAATKYVVNLIQIATLMTPLEYQAIEWLSSKMNHIMAADHAWDLITNLTGNMQQDYSAIQSIVTPAIENAQYTSSEVINGFTHYYYYVIINGQTVYVDTRWINDALEIVDTYVITK